MKKTLTINLGGTVYYIDEDAYHLLDNYLTNLRIHFCREEGAEEIVHDIELRISELFTDRLNEGKQVITIEDVEEIIARMSGFRTGCLYGMGCYLGTYHSIGSWFLCSWGDIGLYHSVDYYSYGAYRSRETRHEGGCY